MPNPCYYHPDLSSVGTCIQCGTPGCADCLEVIGGKMACRRCAGVLKSKVTAPAAAPALGPKAAYNPNAGLNFASMPADYVDTTPVEALKPRQLLMGIALATTVGVLGALGIEKLLFYTHFGFALFYLLLGAAVSGALRAFTGRGGQTMALIAGGIMVVCLGIGHLLYVQDFVNAAQNDSDTRGATFAEMFPVVTAHLKFTHWLLVLGSIILCMVTANRESKSGF